LPAGNVSIEAASSVKAALLDFNLSGDFWESSWVAAYVAENRTKINSICVLSTIQCLLDLHNSIRSFARFAGKWAWGRN